MVSAVVGAAVKIGGADSKTAEEWGTYAGGYVGYFAAFITADPIGGAATAADVALKAGKAMEDSSK